MSARIPSPSCQCTKAPCEKRNLSSTYLMIQTSANCVVPIVDQVFLLLGTPVRKLVVVHPPRLVHEEVGEVVGGSDGVKVVQYILRLQSWHDIDKKTYSKIAFNYRVTLLNGKILLIT